MASMQTSVWQRFAVRVFVLAAVTLLAWSGLAQAQVVPEQADAAIQGLLGDGQGLSGTVIQLFLFVTILSLVPGIAMMVTCLPFMVIVFSILRQALGVQQAPPNMMIMALAMFLTFFIMEPVFMDAWTNGLSPYINGNLGEQEAWLLTTDPFREFMTRRTDPEVLLVLSDALNRPVGPDQEYSFSLLATSFMLSEIKHAFQIGFVIFMPFMVIDLVVASILMAVGMMMVPPTVVSLPFKLGFFVLADGWLKITEALLRGYA
ncbi:MAG: flagellar type III secretion system pore protein FliP [Hyphomonadaceae bacterium]|nr:flagellar type III secretion system pore protein FliP [Hyphomonadaceae bacterium]